MKTRLLIFIILVCSIYATYAQEDFPTDLLEQGSIALVDPILLLNQPFEDADAWENFEDDFGSVRVDTSDEVYIVEVENQDGSNFLWGQDYRVYGDVVIHVDAEQLSSEPDNGYGVMCRANPSNNAGGYYFYVSGDGYAAIFRQDRFDEDVDVLHEWEQTDVINQGRDINELVVVCVDDYLGFYVNGTLVAEAQDDRFDEGVVGFAAAIYSEDEEVEVTFDNLLIWEVESFGEYTVVSTSNTTNTSDTSEGLSYLEISILDDLEAGDILIELGAQLSKDTWDDDAGEWLELDERGFEIEVDDDALRVQEEDGLLAWTRNETEHDDVVMTVDIERASDGRFSVYGLMCRVSDDLDAAEGYSFLMGADASYFIGYWEDGEYTSLLSDDYLYSTDIDEEDEYSVTVVCVDEYLALYVDGELIDEVKDDTFSEGVAGVAALSFDDDGVDVSFDDLVIWEAKN